MSQPFKRCPRCAAEAPLTAPQCLRAGCGHVFRTQFAPPTAKPEPDTRTQIYTPQGERIPEVGSQYPAPYAPPPAPAPAYQQPAYPPQQVYQEPQQPYYAPQPPPATVDLVSALSLTTGAISVFVLPILLGPAAIIMAVAGLVRTQHGRHTGRGMAWAGLVLGILAVLWLVWVEFLLAFVTAYDAARSGTGN